MKHISHTKMYMYKYVIAWKTTQFSNPNQLTDKAMMAHFDTNLSKH